MSLPERGIKRCEIVQRNYLAALKKKKKRMVFLPLFRWKNMAWNDYKMIEMRT